MNDLLSYDALGQAELIARGKTSSDEVLEAAIARAEAINPGLNFLAQPLFDRARHTAAGSFSGPFAGVPFLVKDLHMHIAGERSGEGSRLWSDYRPTYSSTLYERYVAAGLNTFGKTTTPELGLTVTTESQATGLTRNPWNPAHSAGGSSGGAAVAVAAGVVPIAHASDGGGSIRCPASACGVFGLKPSRGRVPVGPRLTESWLGMTVNHAVSRTVRDSAALLDAVHGMETGSRYTAPAPEGSFLDNVTREPGRLRIALMLQPSSGGPVDPDVLMATLDAAKLLERLGHHVEEAAPTLSADELGAAMTAVIGACTAADIAARLRELGRDDAGNDIETIPQMWVHLGKQTTALQLVAANEAYQRAAIVMAAFQTTYDIILSPVFAQPPIELGRIGLSPPDLAEWTRTMLNYSPFTALANQTGQPAMSLPLGMSQNGLPIGIMATARYGEEALLFRLAGQIERAAPWAGRRPSLS